MREGLQVNVASDNSYSIGRTPLVRINRITSGSKATVLAKVEGRNPAYSVKCRIGASMVWQAEEDGLLQPGGHIIEPTSGNTGIALAFVAAARGYRLTVAMPESMSLERRKVLSLLGAHIVLTPAEQGMKGAIACARSWSRPSRTRSCRNSSKPSEPGDSLPHDRTGDLG